MASLLSSSTVLFSDSFPRTFSPPMKTLARNTSSRIKTTASTEPDKEKISNPQTSTEAKTPSNPPPRPKKPQYSMQKGQIVRVDKEKYLNSINYLSVGHPPYYKGLDYIYEDRGEILDLRIFETGEYALVCLHTGSNECIWYLDIGCSRHMMGDKDKSISLKPKEGRYVTFGDNNEGKIIGVGTIGKDSLEIDEIAWVGIPTAPAWLPTEMLIKSEKLDYERI